MAIEKNGQMTYVDEAGNEYLLFPKTKIHQVEGLEAALAGKAPAGYGLGDKAVTAPNNDANQITKCGFFRASVNTPTGDWWTIQQEDLYGDGTHMIQKASCFGYTYVLQAERMVTNGKFYEWEWKNPIMKLGVEYRTTERSNGSVVYAKRIAYSLGDIDASNTSVDTSIPHGISNWAYLVRANCAKDSYVLPHLKSDGGFTSIASVDATNITLRAYKAVWAEATWIIDLYYVKY